MLCIIDGLYFVVQPNIVTILFSKLLRNDLAKFYNNIFFNRQQTSNYNNI